MSTLSNYTDRDLEALAVDKLRDYLVRGSTPRGRAAADEAADALFELRTRERLANGNIDLSGNGTAARARAARVYTQAAGGSQARYEHVSGAIQRRMTSRRRAWLAAQHEETS